MLSKIIFTLAAVIWMGQANAGNIIRTPAPISFKAIPAPVDPSPEKWVVSESIYSIWTSVGGLYSCEAWSPATSNYFKGESFSQESTCLQNYSRTKQEREVGEISGNYRDVGELITEIKTESATKTQTASGTGKCVFNETSPATYWQVYRINQDWNSSMYVNSQSKWTFGTSYTATIIYNSGKTYTRGPLQRTATGWNHVYYYYSVCY